jgi:NADH-quinone oxidoreductase subunit M
VVAALTSAALPGTANFIGEFLILLGAWAGAPWWVAVLGGLTVILTAVYLLRLVQRWLYGQSHHSLESIADLTPTEIVAVVPLLLALLAFGLRPQPIIASCQEVMESLARPARDCAADLAAGRLERAIPPARQAPAKPPVPPPTPAPDTPNLDEGR